MYKKIGSGYVMVETPNTHIVESGVKGVNGKEIVFDLLFDPIAHVRTSATVINVPFDMPNTPIAQVSVGSPGYGPLRRTEQDEFSFDLYAVGGVYNYKFVSDIHPDVEVGDKIYFKKRTLNSPMNRLGVLKTPDGQIAKYLYKVPYENIFCAVKKNGTIIPIGGWTLLIPHYGDWIEKQVPVYSNMVDKFGARIPLPKSKWRTVKIAPEAESMRGHVASIGTPLKGDPCDIKAGMSVLFRRQQKVFLHKIEGNDYIVLPQDQILAQLKKDVKVV